MATFDVSLVTPDGPVYEGEIEMLIVPGADGEIGVLARHAPLIAMLNAGSTRVHVKRETEVLEFATGPGFFKVEQDRALALVDDAVDARQIDDARAREQLEAAQAELERDRPRRVGRATAGRSSSGSSTPRTSSRSSAAGNRVELVGSSHLESFERQLGDQVHQKRLKSPGRYAPDLFRRERLS